eukprot:269487-Alexandrium_andersonii.AAC.1
MQQRQEGNERDIAQLFPYAALGFKESLEAARLGLSPKSALVTSSWALTKRLGKRLRNLGIRVKLDIKARDLGVDQGDGRQRAQRTARERMKRACLLYTSPSPRD